MKYDKRDKRRRECISCGEKKLLRFFRESLIDPEPNKICRKCEMKKYLDADYLYKLSLLDDGSECRCKICNELMDKEDFLKRKGFCTKCFKIDMDGMRQISAFWSIIRSLTQLKERHRRNINVDKNYLLTLAEKQDYKCALTGIPLNKLKSDNFRDSLNPSLDRIDNSKGYEVGNVRWVCLWANVSKNKYSDEVFYKLCKATTEFKEGV